MKRSELGQILIAVLVMFIVISLGAIINGDAMTVVKGFVYAFVLVLIPVMVKKAVAYSLDAGVEHGIWGVKRYGWRPGAHFKGELPAGVIVPLLFSLIHQSLLTRSVLQLNLKLIQL